MDSMVYLVGAGPGDPGLITEKGKELLKSANIVVYDALINKRLLDHCNSKAKLIYVGKKSTKHSITQEEINKILIKHASGNKIVVRLKGGDPFLFGRGGEEAEALINAGIIVEVVPGVSSISAVPGYSGVPLTHRDYNSSFAVITGHENPYKKRSNINWEAISSMDTLVFLMSLKNLSSIVKKLVTNGMPPDTPVMITSWGTLPTQNSVTEKLSDIVNSVKRNKNITTPAVILVGKIVNLRKHINWFEQKPLFGRNILITRAAEQSAPLRDKLHSLGANVIELPTIKTIPSRKWTNVDNSINNFDRFHYVIFTSVNGVKYFFSRIDKNRLDSRIFKNKTIITTGEKTAQELSRYGLRPDLVPRKYTAEGIISSLKSHKLKNKNVLIPRAKIARNILPDTLTELKANVTVVDCYNTVIPDTDNGKLKDVSSMLKSGNIDLATFTSSSTFTNLKKMLKDDVIHLNNTIISTIGPITSMTVKESGFTPEIEAKKHTVEGLIKEITSYFRRQEK